MSDRQAVARFLRCHTCSIHNTGLCGALDDEAIARLGRIARRRRLSRGTVITRAGDPSVEVHNIVNGLVKLSKLLPDGREQIVGLLHPSDFLGCTFRETCDVTAEAATDVELCSFDKAAFERLLGETPELEHSFLKTVLSELDAAREWMVLLGCKSGLERVASFLWFLLARNRSQGCTRSPATGAPIYTIPLSRGDMSLYLGLSMETVSRQISRLAANGAIVLVDARHFTVPDPGRLKALTGEPDSEAAEIAAEPGHP